MEKMFCFQCQETCGNHGCTLGGACGKKPDTAHLQDVIVQETKRIACTAAYSRSVGLLVVQSLFMTITNANFDDQSLSLQIERLRRVGQSAEIPCGVLSCSDADIRSLRELLTYGVKGIAAYACHAARLGWEDDDIYRFVLKALAAAVQEHTVEELVALNLECGATAVKTMELLDKANTAAFGHPQITRVKTNAGTRPGILISGHDLKDLQELLEQTQDAGVDIYTHSEMLPAHYYPELKKYPHLYGNYGNAWHRQNVEFAAFNGPVIMTTNCITPVQESYRHRIFTTGMAGYPDVPHIPEGSSGQPKDFSAVIALAKTCPPPTELENTIITGGFAHHQVLALADKIVDAVKSGAIKRFVVMAGCDGRQHEREYFTRTAQALGPDTVILTAGCAKYRYNKLQLGDINGIPRVLDAGQCNDCYSLAVIALKLKEVFGLEDVNDLPLSFDIAWYEQKAVAVLLALLHLNFKNLRLGPTLPAFLSPNVAKVLVEAFNIRSITTPEADAAAMMAGN